MKEKPSPGYFEIDESLAQLERLVYDALETYSNVHRGSGHNSLVTTRLYEAARENVLEYLDLRKDKYVVIFCTPRRAENIINFKLIQKDVKSRRFRKIR